MFAASRKLGLLQNKKKMENSTLKTWSCVVARGRDATSIQLVTKDGKQQIEIEIVVDGSIVTHLFDRSAALEQAEHLGYVAGILDGAQPRNASLESKNWSPNGDEYSSLVITVAKGTSEPPLYVSISQMRAEEFEIVTNCHNAEQARAQAEHLTKLSGLL